LALPPPLLISSSGDPPQPHFLRVQKLSLFLTESDYHHLLLAWGLPDSRTMSSIRPHEKLRSGCVECKRRKIKVCPLLVAAARGPLLRNALPRTHHAIISATKASLSAIAVKSDQTSANMNSNYAGQKEGRSKTRIARRTRLDSSQDPKHNQAPRAMFKNGSPRLQYAQQRLL
jgi:hypothetical protein